MNPLETIKRQIACVENQRGRRKQVKVDTVCLIRLIEEFERLDSCARLAYGHPSMYEQLRNSIKAVFHTHSKSGDDTSLVIMDILIPLIRNREKEKAAGPTVSGIINNRFY